VMTKKMADKPVFQDFLQFRKELEVKGLFKASFVKEFLMTFYTLLMCALGGYFVFFTSYMWTGLVFVTLGLHQSGWVAHDYLHHAVLPSVYWNETIASVFGIIQGYDAVWWKSRHNSHHVATNDLDHDPDISIAPLLHFVQQYPDLKSTLKHIQRYQHLYYVPILTFLDLDWRFESLRHVYNNFNRRKLAAVRLAIHYIFVLLMFRITGFYPLLLVSLARGFSTAVFVFSNHYTEQRFVSTHTLTLAEQTAYSTRNITGGFFINFFSGNISLQIEHHLFPTMPPHNLVKATPYVKKFFVDHNLPYHESSLLECVSRGMRSLDSNHSNNNNSNSYAKKSVVLREHQA